MATEQSLITEMENYLSASCALPIQLPATEARRIIHRAREWAYWNYRFAVEEKYLAIPREVYMNPNFEATHRQIQLPDCVVTMHELKEITGVGIIGQPERDFSDTKLLGAEIFLSPFQGDNLVYRTAMYSYFDLARNYLLETIAFRFNHNTRRFTVLGRIPVSHTYARVWVKIPESALYEDELFVRYCLAQAKISLGSIFGRFGFNMPGGVTINYADLKQEGQTELEAIVEQVKSEDPPDYFLMWP